MHKKYIIMDEPDAGADDASSGPKLSADKVSGKKISEGLKAGQRIAKISVVTLLAIGVVELAIGNISGSVVATADGID